ncbi:putative trans-sialidase, Group III [Trypanosoma cruzi]|nr:putative trans-sialidase, Group III [Trypanosoma cruzi]
MLSRVAAVMAPNAHNRRRVTGSSGRRREGRESEHQRPSMSRHFFRSAGLLLLFVMMCCGSGAAAAVEGNSEGKIIFKGEESFSDSMNATLVQAFDSFRAPSLVYVNGVVVATVEAHYTNSTDSKSCVSIAAKSMEIDGRTWTKGSAIVFDHYDVRIDRLLRPTAIVKEDGYEINALVGGYHTSGAPLKEVGDGYWTPRMADGKVSGEEDGKMEFEWNRVASTTNLRGILEDYSTNIKRFKQFLGGGGAGIMLEDNSYVLPIQALKDDGKEVSLVMLSKKLSFGWEFSEDTSRDGCIQPAVLEWEDRELVMMTSCDDGSRRVYWSGTMGRMWTVRYGTLSRVWGNSRTRTGHGVQGGFVSAKIDGQKVILVSRPVYSGEAGQETGRLHLWLTDMQRIYDVGPISAVGENVAASTLLYVAAKASSLKGGEPNKEKEKLYCSYEVAAAEGGKYSIAFLDLTERLEDVRKVLAAWKEKDAYIEKEYSCGNEKNNWSSDCDDGDLTKGLVGFLSNTSTGNTWSDEYLCVNATVKNGVPGADGGLTFQGSGAGAEWPVGKMGQNVPYYFANEKFTLMATVSIHKVPTEGSSSPIPLMGVKLSETDSTLIFGLSYTHDKKWRVAFNGSFLELTHGDDLRWEPNTKYHVALHMESDDGLMVYVDGETIYDSEEEDYEDDYGFAGALRSLMSSHSISHFYIGGDSERDSDNINVTVSNVLLYSRAFNKAQLKPLMKKNTVGTPDAVVPAPNVATQTIVASQSSGQPADEPVVTNEAQPSGNANGPAVSREASSPSVLDLSTSAAAWEVKEESPSSSVELLPALSPTPSAGVRREVPETEESVSGVHMEGDQKYSPTNGAASTMEQAGKADEDSSRNVTTNDSMQHSIDREEDTDVLTAVGTNSSTDPATAHRNDNVSGGANAAPTHSSTAPVETKIPSELNATIPSDHELLLEHGQLGDLAAMALIGDSTVHGCVSRVLLLLLLGLWGTAALC